MLLDCGEETTLESPLDCKEIQPIHPKGNQSWIFIGRTDAEAETPILWPPDVKSWLLGNDPDVGKDWRQEKKVTAEDEMVGWHHWLDGHDFEQTLGVGDGQGSLVCCSPWGCKESDTTEQLNWEDIMRNAGLDESQAGLKISGRNINNLRYADDTTLMEESEEELKSLLTKLKKENGKTDFKHSKN